MGIGGFFENREIAGWQVANRRIVHDWFIVLTRDPVFLAQLATRWAELRQGSLSDANITALIDSISTPLTLPLRASTPNGGSRTSGRNTASSSCRREIPGQAQVTVLRDWLLQRAAWFDGEAGNSVDVPDYPFVP
jgi:hypothetical protein